MWGYHGCATPPPTLNMGFMDDIDMLAMIRWPYVEGFIWTREEFLQYVAYCQSLGPYGGHGPHNILGPYRSFFPDDLQNYNSPADSDECDEAPMVTSNDALHFEEDCLFESPSPVSRNAQSPGAVGADVGGIDSRRFLCQKTSTADMTLAELNGPNACDVNDKIGINIQRTVVTGDLTLISDSSEENILPTVSRPANSTLSVESILSRKLTSSNQCNNGRNVAKKLLLEVKTEPEWSGSTQNLESNVKTDSSCLEAKCSLQTAKKSKRGRKLSVTDAASKSSSFSVDSFPVEKKLKQEISDDGVDRDRIDSHPKASTSARTASIKADETNASDNLSDSESLASEGSSVQDLLRSNGTEKRYFWQYNVQAKGPKEKRLCRNVANVDPHVLKDFEDPVFDSSQSDAYFIHSGKARKGDGTDITPNPRKLLNIGNELQTLYRTTEKIMQSADASTREDRKSEKNKYSSRVCRLKKKAKHEANKIKLQGLNDEHYQLMFVLNSIKSKLKEHKKSLARKKLRFTEQLDSLVKSNLKANVAGRSDDYVCSVLLASCSSSADDPKDDAWLSSD